MYHLYWDKKLYKGSYVTLANMAKGTLAGPITTIINKDHIHLIPIEVK